MCLMNGKAFIAHNHVPKKKRQQVLSCCSDMVMSMLFVARHGLLQCFKN